MLGSKLMGTTRGVKQQRKYFDSISTHYAQGNKLNIEFLRRLKKIVTPYIKGDVLDVGSGGVISFDIKNAKSLMLVDIAQGLLRYPQIISDNKFKKINSKKIHTLEASVLNLPLKNNSFDRILMFNVAHHLSEPSLKSSRDNVCKAIQEIYRVLKEDGKLLLLDNCPTSLFKNVLDLGYPFWYFLLNFFNKPLPYFLSESQIKQYLFRNKFITIKVKKIKWSKRVYQPIFPAFSPPGWLWEMVLKNRLFIAQK